MPSGHPGLGVGLPAVPGEWGEDMDAGQDLGLSVMRLATRTANHTGTESLGLDGHDGPLVLECSVQQLSAGSPHYQSHNFRPKSLRPKLFVLPDLVNPANTGFGLDLGIGTSGRSTGRRYYFPADGTPGQGGLNLNLKGSPVQMSANQPGISFGAFVRSVPSTSTGKSRTATKRARVLFKKRQPAHGAAADGSTAEDPGQHDTQDGLDESGPLGEAGSGGLSRRPSAQPSLNPVRLSISEEGSSKVVCTSH